jgi:hypothetical protein
MSADGRTWGRQAVAAALVGLAACAGPWSEQQAKEEPAAPAAQDKAEEALAGRGALEQALEGLPAALAALRGSEEAQRFGAIKGIASLLTPLPLPLENGEVSAIPATPGLEAALRRVHGRWVAEGRRPLSHDQFQGVLQLLNRYVQRVKLGGGRSFVRFTKTDSKGSFAFDKLPAGRWVLATDLSSPISSILWAVAGAVPDESTVRVLLSDDNVLLEGLKRAAPEGEKRP